MNTTVSKWGNSLAVRIPHLLAEKLGLTEGMTVDMEASGDSLTITKPKFKLDDLLKSYSERDSELDWGCYRGNEVW